MQSVFLNGGMIGTTLDFRATDFYQLSVPAGQQAYTTPGNKKNSGIWLLQSSIQQAVLYTFTTATFTPGTAAGLAGPTLVEAQAGLSGPGVDTWKNNTEFFNTDAGIQLWTVPETGMYRIETWGAQGGSVSSTVQGGLGARIRGDFSLTQGQKLRIIVGQSGVQTPAASGNKGGGGGSFVWVDGQSTAALIVAGGGGGSQASAGGVNASTTTDGTRKSDGTGVAGTNGNGTTNGAGFFTNGSTDGSTAGGGTAPLSALNGGTGGTGHTLSTHQGGFGGGGGGGGSPSTTQAGGGGGGYSGGAGVGTPATAGGGGGGSFNSGTNQSNSAGVQSGNGQITITRL